MILRISLVAFSFFICLVTAGFRSHNDVGQKLYERHCARCHGNDGTKGSFGATNLRQSILPDAAIIRQIEKGKGFMPPFRRKLAADEIAQVMIYIKSLRIRE